MTIRKSKQEGLRLLFLKNTIAMLIPAILVFCIILLFTSRYPVIYQMTTHEISKLEEMEGWYQQNCLNVKMNVPQLKYTGYDYYDNEKQIGAYYYAFIEDQCVFFLIKTKQPEPMIENKMVQGKMLEDSASLDAMKNEFAKELGLNYEDFNSFVNPFMISEIDYPYMEVFLLLLLIIVPYIIAISMIVFSVIWTISPFRHPSAKQLNDFGDRRLVFQEIQSQMKHRLLQHNYNYYITEEYLIIHNLWTTDVIRMDFIRYISRHVIVKMKGKKQVYRLTMSNPEKMFYEKDFDSEKCADEIMEALIRLNPKIDNRTMKVFSLSQDTELEEDSKEKQVQETETPVTSQEEEQPEETQSEEIEPEK